VTPNPAISGVNVTIHGAGFGATRPSDGEVDITVTFGGVKAEVLGFSGSSILARTPDLAPGRVDVVVTNTKGESATLAGGLTLDPFAVTAVLPGKGFGDLTYTIFGAGLIEGTTVRFDGVLPTVAFAKGSLSILVGLLPPHGPGPVDVTVTHPLGRSLTIPNALTYVPPPVLTASDVTVTVGGSLTVSWVSETIGPIDFIGLYPEGGREQDEISAQLVSGTSGSMTFTAPLSPGRYEFRYLPFEGQWGAVAARSDVVTVTPATSAHTRDIATIVSRIHCVSDPPIPCVGIARPAGASDLPLGRPRGAGCAWQNTG
jgi:hypothetical protein